ncbi:gamma-glutamyltransferase [Pseudohaliea rubra]|uniref:Glutathione hydrolase proenzyme n=1 Tax=Pseudohaliea rubra DSM 19751 TaxID=1265313 RepID=A0A095VVU0_9GAMM|nr:gamma-glutamyltransferase [Pseudohaliea rubra]KGE05128.1 Gamma-glutamyltranspeptidase [Pseudohaliea rubra DSM 19751]
MIARLLAALLLTATLAADGRAAGALAMPDRFAADAAAAVMAGGGNAIDAAVAAAFTLAVTYPEAGNLGGGGFLLSVMDGEAAFLDFREVAPAAAEAAMYLDKNGSFRARDALVGGLASGVPGTVRGLAAAHARYGTRPWAGLLEPAIRLAREGFAVPADLAEAAAETREYLAGETNFARYFGDLEPGRFFRQPELAATLERIAQDPDDFYRGRSAGLLVAQQARSGGLITAADLAGYEARWRKPLTGSWRGYQVLTAPPPSSGGVALLQLLALREASEGLFLETPHNSARYVHLLAELEKRVFADRARYLADPDFAPVPTDALLDPVYLARRAGTITADAISPAEAVPPGLETPHTTHFSLVDPAGNAVSLTYTLNWDFGSGVVVEGAGFLLNNEMDDFSAAPGIPNEFGVVGGAANAIAPGKRMLSSMTPTILLHGDAPAIVLGTPGGSTIFTSVFQVLLNLVDAGLAPQAAVDAPRYHHQLPQARLIRHDQWPIPAETRRGLETLGYRVAPNDWGPLGDIQLVTAGPRGLAAAADRRGRGVARILAADVRLPTRKQ